MEATDEEEGAAGGGKERSAVYHQLAALARFLNPLNLAARARILSRGRAPAPTIYFVPHNRNNVRLLADASASLAGQGIACRFAVLDGLKRGGVARPELDRRGIPAIDFAALSQAIRPGDILVTGNDFSPRFFRHFIDSINRGPVTVVGMIGGARLLQTHRFRRADVLLAMGPAIARKRPQPSYVVGSPVIERSISRIDAGAREGRYVLINFKGDASKPADRAIVDAEVGACERLALPYVVSVHPTMAARTTLPNMSSRDFGELLPEALALITRPSTTVYEAIACGIPVVLFPPVKPLVEFAEPLGAFRLTHTEAALPDDLARAVASRPAYREIGRAFLEANLSIDPERPASARIADALADIHRRRFRHHRNGKGN